MSLVVGMYGYKFITLGGDRGCWKMAQDGSVYEATLHPESKLREFPGVPMVAAFVGRAFVTPIINAFIERKAYTRETYNIFAAAQELWAEVYAAHDPFAREQLKNAGLDSEETLRSAEARGYDFATTQERRLAGCQLIVAGIDCLGFSRIWRGNYPNRDLEIINAVLEGPYAGCMASGSFAMGSHDVLNDNFDGANFDFNRLNVDGGLDLCKRMIATVEAVEVFRDHIGHVRTVMAPYDYLVITKDGVRWIDSPAEVAA